MSFTKFLDTLAKQTKPETLGAPLSEGPPPQHVATVQTKGQTVEVYARRFPTEKSPAPKRDALGRILPGQVWRPQGPNLSLAPLVRMLTGDGEELVIHAVRIMRGEAQVIRDPVTGTDTTLIPSITQQAEARAWLTEQGHYQVAKALDVTTRDETPSQAWELSKLNADELRAILALARKARPSDAVVEAEPEPRK